MASCPKLGRSQTLVYAVGNALNPFQPTRVVVEIPQIVLHEGHEPDALVDLRHTDALPAMPAQIERVDVNKESVGW